MKQASTTNRRLSGFSKFFLWFVIVNVLLVVAGLVFVWVNLCSYENSLPQHEAQAVMALFESKDYPTIRNRCGFVPSRFTNENDFDQYLMQHLQEDELTLKKVRNESSEKQVTYLLEAGKEPIAQMVLQQQSKEDFLGRSTWQLSTLQLLSPLMPDYVIQTAENVKVQVNGTLLADTDKSNGGSVPEGFSGLPDIYPVPTVVQYRITGLLQKPEITATALNDNICEVIEMPSKERPEGIQISIQQHPAQQQTEAEEIAIAAAQKNAMFITGDAGFHELSSYLVPGSDYYKKVSGFYNGWYIDHDSHSFEDIQVTNMELYSPEHLVCTLSFVYVIQKGGERFEYPSCYQMFLIYTESGWKVANMEVQ